MVVKYGKKPINRIHVGEIRSVEERGPVNKSNDFPSSSLHIGIPPYRNIIYIIPYRQPYPHYTVIYISSVFNDILRVCVMCINVCVKKKSRAITFLAKRSPYVRKADTSVGLTRSNCL